MATPMQDIEEGKPSTDLERHDDSAVGLLPRHEMEILEESEDEDDELEFETVDDDQGRSLRRRRKKSVKGKAWIVLATLSTLIGRGLVRGSFRELN